MIPRPVPASREVAETATPTTCEWRNCIDLAHGPMTYCDEHLRKLADAMNGPLPTPTPALAACPFCGGAAWRMVISETGNSIVKCSVCGAQTNVPYRTKEEADAAWNRRATSPDVARLRDEALDARLDALAAKVEALEAFRSAANNTFNAHGQEMEEISGTMEVCAKGIQGVRERVDKIKPKVHHIPNDAGVMAHIQIAELHRLLAIVLDHAEFAPGQETAEAAIRRALREGAPQPSTGAGVVSEREDATARRTAAPTVEQVVSAVLRVVPVAGSDYGGKSGLVYRADVEQVIRALYAENEKPPMTDRTPRGP